MPKQTKATKTKKASKPRKKAAAAPEPVMEPEVEERLQRPDGDVAAAPQEEAEVEPEVQEERLTPPAAPEEAVSAPQEERKYVDPFSSFERKTPLTGKAHEMRRKLMHEPRVPVMIPLGNEELVGSTLQVTLNGYPLYVRKGEIVMVPVSVQQVIEAKLKHQIAVRNHPLKLGSGDPRDIKLQKFD